MNDKRTPIEPGHLDRRVTVQQAVESVGSSGMPVQTWSLLAVVPMGRESLKGMERLQAGQIASRYDSRWLMPYRADMDPDAVDVAKDRRLVFGGRVQEIVSAQHVGRKEGIELTTMATTKEPA